MVHLIITSRRMKAIFIITNNLGTEQDALNQVDTEGIFVLFTQFIFLKSIHQGSSQAAIALAPSISACHLMFASQNVRHKGKPQRK